MPLYPRPAVEPEPFRVSYIRCHQLNVDVCTDIHRQSTDFMRPPSTDGNSVQVLQTAEEKDRPWPHHVVKPSIRFAFAVLPWCSQPEFPKPAFFCLSNLFLGWNHAPEQREPVGHNSPHEVHNECKSRLQALLDLDHPRKHEIAGEEGHVGNKCNSEWNGDLHNNPDLCAQGLEWPHDNTNQSPHQTDRVACTQNSQVCTACCKYPSGRPVVWWSYLAIFTTGFWDCTTVDKPSHVRSHSARHRIGTRKERLVELKQPNRWRRV